MTQEQFESATLQRQAEMIALLKQINAATADKGKESCGNAEGPGDPCPSPAAGGRPTLTVTGGIDPVGPWAGRGECKNDPAKNPVGEVKTEETTPDMCADGGEPKLFRRPPKMCANPATRAAQGLHSDKYAGRDQLRKALYEAANGDKSGPNTAPATGPAPAMTFERVMAVLKGEREYQRKRWGRRNRVHAAVRNDEFTEARQDIGAFIVFIDHYLTEAKRLLATTSGPDAAMDAMRKVAALCVALGETHGYPSRNPHVTVKNGHDGLAA